MQIRTDLITEIKQKENTDESGVSEQTETVGNVTISTVKILTDTAANELQKPLGTYCTVKFKRIDFKADTTDVINAVLGAFKKVYGKQFETALVIGLGNRDITPDALGPLVCDRLLATRHIDRELKNKLNLNELKSVCCIKPDVIGKTGIESFELVYAAAQKIKPDIIIAVDALASGSPSTLCKTVQITSSGICAGSGVNNARKELSFKTLGIPVIAAGIPTVIDANRFFESENLSDDIMITPKNIDLLITKSAEILSKALNLYLQPCLDKDVIESLT